MADKTITPGKLSILHRTEDVSRFIEVVRASADTEKAALGFLPFGAYDEAAAKGNLFVATVDDQYAGHLLFGGSFPRLKIFQLYVLPDRRRQAVGVSLLNALVQMGEGRGYLAISARVADDLSANHFWSTNGFGITNHVRGGATTGRLINIRVRELDTPNLFRSPVETSTNLGICSPYATQLPVFVIDLNVFWDVVQRRPRSQFTSQILGAAFNNQIRLMVAREFIEELARAASALADPAIAFASELPMLPAPPAQIKASLIAQLAPVIFPNRQNNLANRDVSDLSHLATCIHHNANAFVTSEDRLVRCSEFIFEKYGVHIIHVSQLARALALSGRALPRVQTFLSGETISSRELGSEQTSALLSFLEAMEPARELREEFTSATACPTRKRMAIMSDADIVCVGSWDVNSGLSNRTRVRIIANEEHAAAEAGLECLFNTICTESSMLAPVVLSVTIRSGDTITAKVARAHGFGAGLNGTSANDLQKVAVGRAIHSSNWSRISSELRRSAGLTLPNTIPQWQGTGQKICVYDSNGHERTTTVTHLERLFSPTVLALPGRPVVIVPIRRAYSQDLFFSDPQPSLLPHREAILFSERAYFSSPRNHRTMATGTILAFYESSGGGGRAALVAVARVVSNELVQKRSISAQLLKKGVLEENQISELTSEEMVTVTTFDNVLLLHKPVVLRVLRQYGCVDGANLVTTRAITTENLVSILREGFNE